MGEIRDVKEREGGGGNVVDVWRHVRVNDDCVCVCVCVQVVYRVTLSQLYITCKSSVIIVSVFLSYTTHTTRQQFTCHPCTLAHNGIAGVAEMTASDVFVKILLSL